MERHIALYIRVSTENQWEEGYSGDAQKDRLASYCKSRDLGKYEYYIDGAYSGSNINRPEIQRLIEECKSGKISSVIVYKLDRLSRSQKDTMFLIEDVFIPNNVSFISINESFDTGTPFGRAMVGILSVFAQLERDNIRMRTRMGMEERVKEGYWMGGGRIPFGYDYDKEQGILVPNEDAETVRKIFDMYVQGYAPYKISEILGIDSEKLVQNVLKRKTNLGLIVYNGKEYKGKHEAIVTQEVFDKAEYAMKQRAKSTGHIVESKYLLSGLLECGYCGAKMRYQQWGKYGVKVYCYSRQKTKQYLVRDTDCEGKPIWSQDLEKAVLDNFFEVSKKFSSSMFESEGEPVVSIEEELIGRRRQIDSKIRKLYTLYASGDNDEQLLEVINQLKRERADVEEKLALEKEANAVSSARTDLIDRVSNIAEIWDALTHHEKQAILRESIEKIIVKNDSVKIVYKI